MGEPTHTAPHGAGLGSISDAAERRRLEALHGLGILDTPFEERFNRITRTAARLFGVPTAAVTLVDVNRQWFKACVGLDERESSLEVSLCAIAIRGSGPLVIEDAAADPQFASHPAVTPDDGVRFYAGHPLHLPGGEIPGTLCVFDSQPRSFSSEDAEALHDLAEIVEQELTSEGTEELLGELVRTTARIRAVAGAALEGIVVLAPDGRVEFANEAAAAALGHDSGGLEGIDLHAAVHAGASYCDEGCALARAIERAEPVALGRETFHRDDGVAMPVEVAAAPVVERGDVTGIVLTFADITERVELERVKDELTAHVTHDLRSPLTTIRGFTELVREGVEGERRARLDAVLRATGRLEALINDLLALSELDDPTADVVREPVDVAAQVRELAHDLGAQAASNGLRIEVQAPKPILVTGDPAKLERALANLVSNAVKFSPDGGTVSIRAAVGEGTCAVAVSDQGPGVPPEEIGRLGTRFFRASTSEGVKGTGLGLAITREVAEHHGGEMRVESELGAGSTFTVELPLADEPLRADEGRTAV